MSDLVGGHDYFAFGLSIRSEIALPELRPALQTRRGSPDLIVRLGTISPILAGARRSGANLQFRADEIQLDFPEGRFLVRGGREVVVQPAPGASPPAVRLYLLGSVVGAICHQRGSLPLHANAIQIGGRAMAFAGASGSGKSTLAAHFQSRGLGVLSDDLCVIGHDPYGAPVTWPGVARIKLWADAIAALDADAEGAEALAGDMNKFSLKTTAFAGAAPVPLERLYVLADGDASGPNTIERLGGAAAAQAVISNVYRWEMAVAIGQAPTQFANCIALTERVAVFRAPRRWGFDLFAREVGRLEAHMLVPDVDTLIS